MNAVEVVRSLLEALDGHDFARARALLADDFSTTPTLTGVPMDRDGFLAAHEEVAHALPTLRRHPTDFREQPPGEVSLTMRVTLVDDVPIHLPKFGIEATHPSGRELSAAPHTDHFSVRDGRVVGLRSEIGEGAGLKGLLDQIKAA